MEQQNNNNDLNNCNNAEEVQDTNANNENERNNEPNINNNENQMNNAEYQPEFHVVNIQEFANPGEFPQIPSFDPHLFPGEFRDPIYIDSPIFRNDQLCPNCCSPLLRNHLCPNCNQVISNPVMYC
ncbi:hypothetical protein TVAG_063890 [Trichomonas vaginalis G3]|uniref:Uncharacterized protein n=1 Tax=Trichomonas vaginalis (strain ATCC PRA-98 / G3) TaxID=412133 RepID=A2FG90_TRIV3|nr:hypothetical protein TVAGG3_0310210 [Trichomonas vaginalis G3]EAX96086.1 hypothetical protein TVAG_063890 [Trichomonas vaginalis G3]KAI5528542.1 hypothetical protein TVAGG3_0310210 [Trichomonas vaginalis G3]|eukprot:XP_001309016.1 hypothetical protein [Trichomonas vaginalis G3]